MSTEPIRNKVNESGIIAFDLATFKPEIEIVSFDLKPLLYMELIVKEKEFRTALAAVDFTAFNGKAVAVYCTVDAIIPQWVHMVIADKLYSETTLFKFCTVDELRNDLWESNVLQADITPYKDQKVVVRANPDIPVFLYMTATKKLKPIVKSLLYGEIGMPKVIFK
ncbi:MULTISPECIES: DUF2480 family protein [unclassified Myroides]|uniref:DUF2480 family protein n=1 Tax=unclassified Myroides TaxID=2642485 RepID=UPI003D2F8435